MQKKRKLIVTCLCTGMAAIILAGLNLMLVTQTGSILESNIGIQQKTQDVAKVLVYSKPLSLPEGGMGKALWDYLNTQEGSSVELLSATPLAASFKNTYNEYYSSNGEIQGKTIVYTGSRKGTVYDKIPGNERVEKGEVKAKPVGHIRKDNVATLLRTQGEWYQILSDEVSGYIKKEAFAVGVEAEKLDAETYTDVAMVKNEDAYCFTKNNVKSKVLCVLPEDVSYETLKRGKKFSKISVPELGEGWTQTENIKVSHERTYAIAIEEEEEIAEKIEDGRASAEKIEKKREKNREEKKRLEEERRRIEEEWAAKNAEALQMIQKLYNPNTVINGAESLDQVQIPVLDSDSEMTLRTAIVDYARQFVGILPYRWAHSDLTYGADCSGFTSAIFREFGIELSRSSDVQTWAGESIPLSEIRPGDIVCYYGHVALYAGDGIVIHAPHPGAYVSYDNINMMPIINIARYIPASEEMDMPEVEAKAEPALQLSEEEKTPEQEAADAKAKKEAADAKAKIEAAEAKAKQEAAAIEAKKRKDNASEDKQPVKNKESAVKEPDAADRQKQENEDKKRDPKSDEKASPAIKDQKDAKQGDESNTEKE